MSKIRLYPIDTDVTGGDKVIGTDSFTKATKNFTVSDIADFLNKSSSIDSQTLRYKFQVPVVEPRAKGTISFKPNQGDTVNFNTITTFLLSKFSLKYVFIFFDILGLIEINPLKTGFFFSRKKLAKFAVLSCPRITLKFEIL